MDPRRSSAFHLCAQCRARYSHKGCHAHQSLRPPTARPPGHCSSSGTGGNPGKRWEGRIVSLMDYKHRRITNNSSQNFRTIDLKYCKWQFSNLRTCEGSILSEEVFRCGSKQNEGINDATFRDPAHICLGLLIGALHIIEHFPKHSLDRNRSK